MHRGETVKRVMAATAALLGAAMADAVAQDLPPPAERIQRQADNPLRWIVEAGKLKARVKVAETPTAKPPARSAAARVVERSTAALPVRMAEAVPASPATPATPAAAELPAEPAPSALELLAGDGPTLPDDIDAQLESDARVDLALIVLADGSVGALSVLASTHQAVDEHAMAAVRGWRFRPLAQAQVHKLELVIHPRH